LHAYVLSSGSTGNAILLEAGGSRVLVDAGVSPRIASTRLRELGADLFPRGVDAVVVTHQHNDHFAFVESLARVFHAPLYLHAGILARRVRARWEVRDFAPGVPFSAGGFQVSAVTLPHDAPQVGLAFTAPDGARFGVATDLGHVPARLVTLLSGCDVALVEANYCPQLLAVGPYPERLRQRIRNGFGHLANEQTADLARQLVGTRMSTLYLGHISRSNNSPERALEVVRARSSGLTVEAIPHGVPRALDVRPSGRACAGARVGEQLALAL
jgi:phosphoribosyl 1,2-cyclic phosphodiesterase